GCRSSAPSSWPTRSGPPPTAARTRRRARAHSASTARRNGGATDTTNEESAVPDTTGSLFEVPAEADLPEGLRNLFAKASERLGFVQNVVRASSFAPDGP